MGGALVAGHLFAQLGGGTAGHHFAQLSLSDPTQTWHAVDANTRLQGAWVPMTIAVDPDNASHIYLGVATGTAQMTIYASGDGGGSWHALYTLPNVTQVRLWAASGGRVYVQQATGTSDATQYQFFYSGDAGKTWNPIGLHDRGADRIAVSPTGRVMTLADGLVFALDPTTGIFARLGVAPAFAGDIHTAGVYF